MGLKEGEGGGWGRDGDVPTAVNLDRTWMIIMAVMMSAAMCTMSTAPWKMIVLASSTVRE